VGFEEESSIYDNLLESTVEIWVNFFVFIAPVCDVKAVQVKVKVLLDCLLDRMVSSRNVFNSFLKVMLKHV